MSPTLHALAPTSSLPPLRRPDLERVNDATITEALRNLTAVYCPLPRAAAFRKPSLSSKQVDYLSVPAGSGVTTPGTVDSGYASGEEDEDDRTAAAADTEALTNLRADDYERQFAIRWLTSLIARAEELLCDIDDDSRQQHIDSASYILASFSSVSDAEQDEDAGAIVREFKFRLGQEEEDTLEVQLTDGTPAVGSDHTDVGLQSWGASIVVSDLMCARPDDFDLTIEKLGHSPRIIELGAGTGLVGITMAKLLPRLGMAGAEIIATDYHPTVLANLKENVLKNFSENAAAAVQTCLLDWSAPCLDAPLDTPADMLIATDVVYAPEHATWLRDCAAQLLKRDGVFWLVASVRPNGKFEGVTDTVEAVFADASRCPRLGTGDKVLQIVDKSKLEKRKGVGRGDEIGYKVFRIGWVDVETGKAEAS
ncbi:methyltransferase domain-containing protein [Coniella lustricola]|uniref:Methyltransferase domain-containing protein n=1 Tax=Coniella lustricola TaxID=2025994 RepID=A0A2T3A1X3_9PEZI|nr:methyltransferase domain-containing protein [Coniella lustricola]